MMWNQILRPLEGKKAAKKKGGRKCGNCGEAGHRADRCGTQVPAPVANGEDNYIPPLLTEEEFNAMKELQRSGDLSSRNFASEHNLALSEVNRAIPFSSYDDYSLRG